MSGLLLTPQERERFAAWLETEAASAKVIIEQMEKSKFPDVVMQREKMEMMAALVIAKKLRSIQDQSIG